MSLVRYEPPVNEVVSDQRYMDRLEKMAETFARSNLCPEAFRGRPNDVAVIGYSLADIGLRLTLSTLNQCYVVHGRTGLMAQLQAGIAERYGYRIKPVEKKCSDEIGVVEITDLDGEIHEVEFTKADAAKAGLWGDAKKLYGKYPKDMLIARATTRAIKRHAPAVLLGLAGAGIEPVGLEDVERVEALAEPKTAEPEPIPAAKAKTLLVQAYMEDYEEDRAKEMAAELWKAHGLTREPISEEMMAQLLDEAKVTEAEVVEDGEPFTE